MRITKPLLLISSCSFHLDFVRLLIILIICFPSTHTDATCNPVDKESLLPLATRFPQLNWSDANDCCSWEGISCDDKGNRVVELSIPNRGLRGAIVSSVQNLTSLSILDMSYNFLSGSLPDGLFSSFNNLKIIDLSYNRLSGHLPDSFPATLHSLNLSSNHFGGMIENAFLHFSPALIALNISNNSFFGAIPPSICTSSAALVTLDFSLNDFSGNIPPVFGNCSKLQVLSLGFNDLTGRIPIDIEGARSLEQLYLPGNYLTGEIDESITNLTNLRILTLFGNLFSGSIPHKIGKLSFLEKLELHINRLNGTLPLSLTNCSKLQQLNLRVNSLVGKLADFDFSNFSNLTIIDLGENQFNGVLPRTLFSCKTLAAIRLAGNKLEGEVLADVLELPSLTFLSLSNNTLKNIRNTIDILSNHTRLMTLILSLNFFNETLPHDGISGFVNLKVIGLGGCKMFGQVPTWLRSLTNLEVVDLSQNYIGGTIPGWLQSLPNLFYLDLSNNDLSGGFPIELTRLPALASQKVLDHVDQTYLELPVFIAPKNSSYLQYNQLTTLHPALYLASNNLSGEIPIEIGNLQAIHILDLSQNNFNGRIPSAISNLTNLEKLDLSHNLLSGEIPASLKSLHFLSSFSVAYNNLQGHIPSGGQFDTFLNWTYEGNSGLCGPPLQKICSNESSTTYSSLGHKNVKLIVGLIVGICSVVGIALTCLAWWILSTRRILLAEIFHTDLASFDTTSVLEVHKDIDGVILFPNNVKGIKELTINDIMKATTDFSESNIIGCGGFGMVYKATLENGTKLVVKKLSRVIGLVTKEFEAEVMALSIAQHKNLVSLQGYYIDNEYRLLLYLYMENGSLEYWLHEKTDGASRLNWPTRLKIAQGASRGLAYLHHVCEPRIVHRDIKSSNILLDEKFEAYVADFGFSRFIQPYNTHVSTELVGTFGYIPPEYSQSLIATTRGDIYSFGVVLLEILTGKRPMDVFKSKESTELVVWVQQLRIEGKQYEVFDPILQGKGFEVEMLEVLDVACMCVNVNPFKRPNINEVADWLHDLTPCHEGSY